MRFLVDECLSPLVAGLLAEAGHDALHVQDCDLLGRPDEDVMARAVEEQRVLLSADTDFSAILARTGSAVPSVVLFRRGRRQPRDQVAVLVANHSVLEAALEAGAVAVLTDDRIRIRYLPITT